MRVARWEHFRRDLAGEVPSCGGAFAVVAGGAVAAATHDPLSGMAVALALVVALILAVWRNASHDAEDEFFAALAPTLGLRYMVSGALMPIVPLLAAGGKRSYAHYMEGPIFGARGGPTCGLAHYAFTTLDDRGNDGQRFEFTVCGMEVAEALPLLHGVYLRPRRGLVHDWLDRAPRPATVELESTFLTERYELRAAPDQDRLVLHELFAPSFQAWLGEHPLRPGFECRGGQLVVYLPGHEFDGDRLTLLHEASREIARRVCALAAKPRAPRALTPAG